MEHLENKDIIKIEIPANNRYLSILSVCVGDFFEKFDCLLKENTKVYSVQLAIHEICSNIIEHSYRGLLDRNIKVEFFIDENNVFFVDIYDNGTLFNLKEVNLPSLDKPQVRGYGLFIVQNLMDKVIYEETHDRNHWRLVKVFS